MSQCTVTYALTNEQETAVKAFFNSIPDPCIEQYPGWLRMCYPKNRICSFILQDGGEVVLFAEILEVKDALSKTAIVQFGPLCNHHSYLVKGIDELFKWYKQKGYTLLKVQMGQKIDAATELSEHLLNQKYKIRYSFDKNSNWSSIALNLAQPEDVIFRNFSKGHKSSIKKAIKEGVSASVIVQLHEVEEFGGVYVRMNKARGLPVHEQETIAQLKAVFRFLQKNQLGQFFALKDIQGKLIGGLVIIYQGQTVRYYKGAADPDYRHLPILHLGMYEAIKHARELGKASFDFWGYNHLVEPDDQRFNINIFKKGFGGEFIFYPKELTFEINQFRSAIKGMASKLYRQVKKS
jgi:lipid II:glycine glycyltransferase (peptidoglycan interpeptide bridge formation enzyme)